jgi:hypothetical protein
MPSVLIPVGLCETTCSGLELRYEERAVGRSRRDLYSELRAVLRVRDLATILNSRLLYR